MKPRRTPVINEPHTGRSGKISGGFSNVLSFEAEHGRMTGTAGETEGTRWLPRPRNSDDLLRQWELVRNAWDDDFSAYRRYVGIPASD